MENLSKEGKTWPMLLDMTKGECSRTLRALELATYSNLISVFRAQGELTKEKRKILGDLQSLFSISLERHRAEIRRAVNDELLNTIAETLAGPNTNIEWSVEGRRLIPLLPRVPPQVSYTALATQMAQLYCGINSTLPKPSHTAIYGKKDDLGAESDMTDSEEETEGLRFLPESMIPQQYVADHGTYTTLPNSLSRITKEKAKEAAKPNLDSMMSRSPSPSPPSSYNSSTQNSLNSSSSIISPPSSTAIGSKSSPSKASDKRKRKRSTDHLPPHPPPPPPSTHPPSYASSVPSLGVSTTARQTPGSGSSLTGSNKKVTVTGGATKTSTALSISSSQTQKVILVSTSAPSGTGSVYQRSLNVPILKTSSQPGLNSNPLPSVQPLKSTQSGAVSSANATASNTNQSLYSGSTAIVIPSPLTKTSTSSFSTGSISSTGQSGSSLFGKIKPRVSGASSSSAFLAGGSTQISGLPARIPRQRSNSLILQADNQQQIKGDSSLPRVSSILPDSTSGTQGISSSSSSSTSTNFVGSTSTQLRPAVLPSTKSSVQVRSDGTKLINPPLVSSSLSAGGTPGNIVSTSSSSTPIGVGGFGGGRILNRTSSLPSSQGLYVVSTNSGTITVVTRTVASGHGAVTTPRLVTVNTANPRSSLASSRSISSPSVVSVGITPKSLQAVRVTPQGQSPGIRSVMAGSKNNVIVVHKGAMPAGTRPVGITGIRDLSARLIKSVPPVSTSIPVTSNSLTSSGSSLSSGFVVVKPTMTSARMTPSTTSSIPATPVSVSSAISHPLKSSGISNKATTSSSIITTISCVAPSTGPAAPGKNDDATPSGKRSFAKREAEDGLSSVQARDLNQTSSFPKESSMEKTRSNRDEAEFSTFVVDSTSPPASNSLLAKRDQDFCYNKVLPDAECGDEPKVSEDDEEKPSSSTLIVKASPSNVFGNSDAEANIVISSGAAHSTSMDTESESMESTVEDGEDSDDNGTKQNFSSPTSIDHDDPTDENEWLTLGLTAGDEEDVDSAEEDEHAFEGVERAVEVLQQGDHEQARTLLFKAGFELIEAANDSDTPNGGGLAITNLGSVSSSSGMLSAPPIVSSTPNREEGDSSFDSSNALLFNPSTGENSSDQATPSTQGGSPAPKDEDSLGADFMEVSKE